MYTFSMDIPLTLIGADNMMNIVKDYKYRPIVRHIREKNTTYINVYNF